MSSVWSGWPGLQVASGLVAKPFPSVCPPTLSFRPSALYTQLPQGALPDLSLGAPSCSAVPGCSQPAPCNLALEFPLALRHSLIILCMAGLHSWVLSVGNVVVCLFVCCLFWSSWRLLTDKHCMGVALLVKACRSFMGQLLRISGWRKHAVDFQLTPALFTLVNSQIN